MKHEDKLLKRIEQGDASAIDELIAVYYPEILRYCLWHAPNHSLAEDAAQETFLKAIRYFDRYTHKGKFRPFLYKIAVNTCIDMHRKNCCSDLSLEELTVELAYTDPALAEIQSDLTLKQLVHNLPDNLQELVLLRFGQDMSLREIAEVVDLPLRTVQSRLRSALKQLKKDFEEEASDENYRF